MSEQPVIFADQLEEMNVAYGVARLRMSQVATDGQMVPAGTLIVPMDQLAALAEALGSLVQQLQDQVQEQADDAVVPAMPG